MSGNEVKKSMEYVLSRIRNRYLQINSESCINEDIEYDLLDPNMDSPVLKRYGMEDLLDHSYDLGQYYLLRFMELHGRLPY